MQGMLFNKTDNDFGHWLAGFTDGEGFFIASFCTSKAKGRYLATRFGIKLRADDKPILEKIQSVLGIGFVKARPSYGQAKPMAYFEVYNNQHLMQIIIPFFERYPLQTKKAKDFVIWRKIVIKQVSLRQQKGGCNPYSEEDWAELESLVTKLKEGRKFQQ